MTNLKWGFSTLGAPEMTMEELAQLANKHDIHYIEVRTAEKRIDIPALFDEKYPDPDILRKFLKDKDVKIIGLNSGFKLLDNYKESRDELLSFARWAKILDVPYIRIFGGLEYGTALSLEHYSRANETLDWWFEEKKRNAWDSELLLETHDVFSNSDGILQFLGDLKHPLNLIWDSHHTFRFAGEEFSCSWDKLKKYTRHIHVKDSISKPSVRHDHTYTMPGEGELNVKDLLTILKKDNFDGVVSIEWEKNWHPYLPTMDAALVKAKEAGWI